MMQDTCIFVTVFLVQQDFFLRFQIQSSTFSVWNRRTKALTFQILDYSKKQSLDKVWVCPRAITLKPQDSTQDLYPGFYLRSDYNEMNSIHTHYNLCSIQCVTFFKHTWKLPSYCWKRTQCPLHYRPLTRCCVDGACVTQFSDRGQSGGHRGQGVGIFG